MYQDVNRRHGNVLSILAYYMKYYFISLISRIRSAAQDIFSYGIIFIFSFVMVFLLSKLDSVTLNPLSGILVAVIGATPLYAAFKYFYSPDDDWHLR
jgi:hypothetical protein